MSETKKYWNSLEQLDNDAEFIKKAQNEFPEAVPVDEFVSSAEFSNNTASRRDFLKFLGFSVSAATLAACEAPVTKAIPYVVKPEDITPGVPNYYASTYADGNDYCSILVKTRDGRPIHIEGNKLSGVTKGGVNARVNASVLSLYDSKRLKGPMSAGQEISWADADSQIIDKLEAIKAKKGNIRILTNSIMSPSTQFVINDFIAKYSGENNAEAKNKKDNTNTASEAGGASVKHVTYDAISYSGILNANESSFGKRIIPDYRFDKAKVIVSIGADFLVNWLSSIEYAPAYAKSRNPKADWMSKHYQFEATMSLTGSNADIRGAIKPSEYGAAVVALYNKIAAITGAGSISGGNVSEENGAAAKIEMAAKELAENKGNSLVVCGSNDTHVQVVVNAINNMLENYGKTIDINSQVNIKSGDDGKVAELIKEMNDGKVDALIIYGVNPVYSMPSSWNFTEALNKAKFKISFSSYNDETASVCDYICPDNHYLESWNDANPKAGFYSLSQPVIRPLFNTRQAQASLLKWSGKDNDFHNYVQSIWEKFGFPRQTKYLTFAEFWNASLHDGVSEMPVPQPQTVTNEFKGDVSAAASSIGAVKGGEWEMELYVKTGIGDGSQANNPWLQELPDPVTKVVWDNYITMNPADMKGVYNTKLAQQSYASLAKVVAGGNEVTLPVVPLPGQKKGTVGVALGYGKAKVGEEVIGKNVFPFVSYSNGTQQYSVYDIKIEKVDGEYEIASTQTQHTMMGRKIVNETTIDVYKNDNPEHWNHKEKIADSFGNRKNPTEINLWSDHDINLGHRWGMSIDLSTCIGCSACVTACSSENNVPVVGRDEVRRNRDMFWLRIDRYFSSDAKTNDNGYAPMEDPSEYPEVVFQPVMCQHCNHAPCETVCPVTATTHSNEGLNQMVYNRCVGTRYCANNCPYKVRRFNWFNYPEYKKFKGINPAQEELGRMVLNPDVVVRSRGVMEKCSLCVQRIQGGKLQAKKDGTPVQDGAIETACSSACPTNAITFGDVNDKNTKVFANTQDERGYHLLEEIGVQPNIWYLTKVRNKNKENEPVQHA
jgi:MoCo/4Fe-4S cofactor protein with predicted Tat translocation signal